MASSSCSRGFEFADRGILFVRVAILGLMAGCAPARSASPVDRGAPSPSGDSTNAVGPVATVPAPPPPSSEPPPPPPRGAPPAGVVSFVQVTSDRVPDVSSLEAWQRSFIHDGMSDQDKALAIWRSVVAFRHQDEPAREFIETTTHPHDPIRLFNVYGYSQCDCAASAVEALARSVGLDARVRALNAHTVAEVSWSGRWHMLDAAYIDWFPSPGGAPASVDDLTTATNAWLGQHPDLAGNRAGLLAYMSNGGWRNGPSLLAASPFYDNDGLFPARVQGWADTMLEYPPASAVFEPGYTLGYRVNMQLRRGERIVRRWANDGRHLDDDLGLACAAVGGVPGAGDFVYSPSYGDLAPGRVGNGTHEWEVPLAGGAYRDGALTVDNLADGGSGALVHVADASRPGVLIVRMPSSYVDLGGALRLDARVPSGGRVAVAFSRNHGLDWSPVSTFTAGGSYTVDLSPWVRRQYDYRLRIELDGAGTGLDALSIVDTIQYSQRALPALGAGDNTIRVTTGAAQGTLTLEAGSDSTQTLNRVYTELHPIVDGLVEAPLRPSGGRGAITFPLATPGDLVRLRFGTSYRARGAGDRWDYEVSFDGGASFTRVASAAGPNVGGERFVAVDAIPPGTRAALVRFAGTQTDTLNLFDFRIDADYAEPAGGFAPLRVTYQWEENGKPRSHTRVIAASDVSYTIHCDATPKMRALTVERADD